jgi:hypothetical protein
MSLALVLSDIGAAGIGGNLLPLTLQGEIDGRDFILGLNGVLGNAVNGHDTLGHSGDSCS